METRALENCRHGLVAMGATDYVAIFDSFMTIMTSDPARAEAIRSGSGFGDVDHEITQLDSRFYKLGDMTALNARWIRGLPVLCPLPAEAMDAAYEAIVARNQLHAARIEHRQRAREHHAASDPLQVAARAACAQEGITFEGVNAGIPTADGAINWGLRTSDGFRLLGFDDRLAITRNDAGNLRAHYFFASKSPYPSGTGNGSQRRSVMSASDHDVRVRIGAALRAAPQHQNGPAIVVAEFLADTTPILWANLSILSKRANIAMVCPYSREIASHAAYLPRAASPRFAPSEEFETFRLIVGNALWDSVLAMDALNDAVFADGDRAAALLANLGAAATLAASCLRMLDSHRIHALSLIGAADLERERINMRLQFQEIARWWQRFVPIAIANFAKTQFPQRRPLFGNPRLSNARLLAQQLRATTTTGITDALAYFDSEYPALPSAQLPAIYDKAVDQIIRRFAGSRSQTKTWMTVVAELRRVIATVYPYDEINIFAVPKKERFLSRQSFFGTALAVRGAARESQHFIFDSDGARKPLPA